MRKFMTICVAVVLCLAALTVFASAANTNCVATGTANHDWTAWKTVQLNSDGSGLKERSCACGRVETEVIEAPHKHSIAHVPATEACHVPGTAEFWYCTDPECEIVFADEALTQVTNRKNLAIEPDCALAYVPATEACHVAGSAEYWYCPECDAVYADAEGTQLTNRKNLAIEPVCALAHVPAAEACHVAGSAEYWYCVKCEAVYADAAGTQLTNRKNLATEAVIELVHHEAIAPCHANGYLEYWYCPKCDNYFADAAATQQTNIKNLTVEGDLSKLEYHAAVAATATANGMQEYWYCAGCDCFFTDAEGKYNIAYLSLTIPATGEVVAPDTGDNAIFFIVALVAVATLGVAAVSFKKREN